jgi:hypothetical protein
MGGTAFRTGQASGNIAFLRRVAVYMMLGCLMLIQAHAFVPHHHHDDEAPAHRHAADHHAGFGHHADHGNEFDDPHPPVAPHDEPSLSEVSQRNMLHFALVLDLPVRFEVLLASPIGLRQRETFPSEHPYATGPPGTKSSRAPPASLTA